MVMKSYSTKGDSFKELLENVKAMEKIPALDDLITAVPKIVGAVLEETGLDANSDKVEIEGVIYVYVGVGVSAGVWLGWLDTVGYRMVGAEGSLGTLASLGASLRVGKSEDGTAARVVAYLTNVGIDVVIKQKGRKDPGLAVI